MFYTSCFLECIHAANFRQIWETIAEDLKQAIIRGELKGGQRLRIDELSVKYGVSSTPIRDAFRHLASLGFIENIPRRMVVVRGISSRRSRTSMPSRASWKGSPRSWRQAVRRWDVESLARLFRRMAECVRARGCGRVFRGGRASFTPYSSACAATCASSRWSRTPAITSRDFASLCCAIPAASQESVEEHRRIVAAFRARDAEAANREVKNHILVSAELLKRIIGQRGAPGVFGGCETGRHDRAPHNRD